MYIVVGCPDCRAVWINQLTGETATCPQCRRAHQVDRLRRLAERETIEGARDARTAILAERDDQDLETLAGWSELSEAAETAGIDDTEYFTAMDVPEPSDQSDASTTGPPTTVIPELIAAVDNPTRAVITEQAEAVGIDPERTEDVLDRLISHGEVLEEDGRLRRL